MKYKKILITICMLFFLTNSIYADETCPSYEPNCQIQSLGQKTDQEFYEISNNMAQSLFFDPNSLLRTNHYDNNEVAMYLNDIVLRILVLCFQLWYIWICIKFYSTGGDIEKIQEAKDSLKRFFITLLSIAFVSILFMMFTSITSTINSAVADVGNLGNIFAPDPTDYPPTDPGIFTSLLRLVMMFGMMLLALFLVIFKMVQSLLLPLFTLFIFLKFTKKDVVSSILLKLLIYAEIIPGIFFLIIMVLDAILKPISSVGLATALTMGIISIIASAVIFFFIFTELFMSFFVKSFIGGMNTAVYKGISRGMKNAFKHIKR